MMPNNKCLALYVLLVFIVPYNLNAQNISQVGEEVRFIKHQTKLLPENIPFYDDKHNKHYFDEMDQKTILLVFWASWLPESREILRKLDCLAKDFRRLDFTIIALSEDYLGIEALQEFFKKNNIRHIKIYYDYQNIIYKHIGIKSLPEFWLITAKEEELVQILGNPKWDEDAIRNTLLGYIPGNPPIQKNTYDKSSLNVIFQHNQINDKAKQKIHKHNSAK